MSIVAAIVAFNPDLDRLAMNLDAISGQVDDVVIVDNASTDQDGLFALLAEWPKVQIIPRLTNGGMSRALNAAFEWADEHGAKHLLVLDQDSVCQPGMVALLATEAQDGIAIIAPEIRDRNLAAGAPPADAVVDVAFCITSGGLYCVSAWKKVGGYDEMIFVDFVDFDYCLRVRMAGYRIRRMTSAVLIHEIGRIERHGSVLAYNHSAFRSYYMTRDMVYYARKHARSPKALKVGGRGVLLTCAILARKALIILRFESEKSQKVSALVRGAVGGFKTPIVTAAATGLGCS